MPVLKCNKKILAEKVWLANTSWTRMRGLLGRQYLPLSEVMWIKPCNSIHTFFMKFPIDAVFADRNLIVRKVVKNIPPGKLLWPIWSAHSTFEFAAGFLDNTPIHEGDQLHVDP